MATLSLDPNIPYDQGKLMRGSGAAAAPFNPTMRVAPNLHSPNIPASLDTSSIAPDGMAGTALQPSAIRRAWDAMNTEYPLGNPLHPTQDLSQSATAQNIAATTAPPAAAPPAVNWNGAPPTRAAPGPAALTNGVRRYNIGGDTGGANAAQVYTTMGKDGVPIFTDNAAYAERNSNGKGLNKTIDAPGHAGGVTYGADGNASYTPATPGYDPSANPTTMYANSMGPNATKDYMTSQLAAGGATPGAIAGFTPAQTQTAYARAQNFSANDPHVKGVATTDQGVSDDIALNQLRARMSGTGGSINGVGGAASPGGIGAGYGMTPQTQIAMHRALADDSFHAATLKNAEANRVIAQQQADTAKGSAEERATKSNIDTYQKIIGDPSSPPGSAANYLTSQIPSTVDKYNTWKDTDAGKFVLQHYLSDILQPGATNATNAYNVGDRNAVPQIGYGNLELNADNSFNGVGLPGEPDAYPANKSPLSRLISKGRSITGPAANFDPSINNIAPGVLREIQRTGRIGGG